MYESYNLNHYSGSDDFMSNFPGVKPLEVGNSYSPNLSDYNLNNFDLSNYSLNLFNKSKRKEEVKTLKGSKEFENAFELACLINPEVRLYKNFLVKTAKRESNFNSSILNTTGAPYYGYFLMGKNEIKSTTGLSVSEFRNNPVQLILGAVKLYKMNLKTIKALGVYEIGKLKGYSDDALVTGAWLAGPGGVKKYLLGKGNPSDSHWYKNGKGGTSVGRLMNAWK